MASKANFYDYNIDSIRSPLKTPLNSAAKNSESVHTIGIDVGDGPLKGLSKLALDKHVAEI